MNYHKFQQLLLRSESSTLDFKRQQYDFLTDIDGRKTAEFVKDVISFCNTIRNESAFIIIGVDSKSDGSKELIGLNADVDDSILQEKIKNKVIPIPEFSYSTLEYEGSIFGILEFPVRKYDTPITVTQKLKGLEPGQFYFRRNSSNSQANGFETINIAKWLESLPANNSVISLVDKISQAIRSLTNKTTLLSVCISDCFGIANLFDLKELKRFCTNELSGWEDNVSTEEIETSFGYRVGSVLFTSKTFSISPYSGWDARRMILELKKTEDVYETRMFFPFSVPKIEEYLSKLAESKNMLITLQMPARKFMDDPEFEDLSMTVIMDKDNFDNIYLNIRQKLIDQLIHVH